MHAVILDFVFLGLLSSQQVSSLVSFIKWFFGRAETASGQHDRLGIETWSDAQATTPRLLTVAICCCHALFLYIAVIHCGLSCRTVNEHAWTVDPQRRPVTVVIYCGYALWLYIVVIHLSCRAVIEHTRTVDPQRRLVTFVTDRYQGDHAVSKAYKKSFYADYFHVLQSTLFILA